MVGHAFVQPQEIAVKDNFSASADMAPMGEAVHLVVGIRPAVVDGTSVERREMVPAADVGILHDACHVAVFPFEFGIVVKLGHHDRREYAVFGRRLADVCQSAFITLATVAAGHGIIASGVSVFIPTHEVHAHEVHPEVVIMFEPSVDVFAGAGVVGHKPSEISPVGHIGIHHDILWIAGERAQGIVCAGHFAVEITFDPQRIVIDTHFQTFCSGSSDKFFERHRPVVRHIDAAVPSLLGQEAVGTDHIVAVRLEFGGHHVDYRIPLVGSKIHLIVGNTGNFEFPGIFIDRPIKRSFVFMNITGNR